MERITPTTKLDLRDPEYIKKILKMLLFYKRSDLAFQQFLEKLLEFWDISIVDVDEFTKLLKFAIKETTKLRIKQLPLEQIRNQIILKFPQLEEQIRIWEEENLKEDLRNEYDLILQDLTNKFKIFSVLKFASKFKEILAKMSNPYDDEKDYDDYVIELNNTIKEFQEDINYEPKTEEFILNPDLVDKLIDDRLNSFLNSEDEKIIIPSAISFINLSFNNLEGYEKKKLYMFGSTIGTGKTRFMVNEGSYAFQKGLNVLHITIENDIKLIYDYYISNMLGIPIDELYKMYRRVKSDEKALKQIQQIKRLVKELIEERPNKLAIKKFPVKRTTPNMIELYIKQISNTEFKPDIVIIDHIDLLIPNSFSTTYKNSENLFLIGEELITDLKYIAETYNLAILTPSQLTREGQKVKTQTDTLSERTKKTKRKNPFEEFLTRNNISRSLAKIEYVDFFATLNKNIDEQLSGTMRIFIDKNRDGVDGLLLPIYFDTSLSYARAMEELEEILAHYGDVPLITKSVAYLYYRACLDETLAPKYIDKLEKFLPYLDEKFRAKAVKIIHQYKTNSPIYIDTSNFKGKRENINLPNTNSEQSTFLNTTTFINKLIEEIEENDNNIVNVNINESEDEVSINFEDGKIIKTKLSDLHLFKNSIEDEELREIIDELIS
jgi:hypothetical protein